MQFDNAGLPKLKYPKLKPCVQCGSDVNVYYRPGLSKEIRETLGDLFAANCPVWYICCDNCLNNLRVKIKPCTFEAKQKALTVIGKAWNSQWNNDLVIEQLRFVKLESKDGTVSED